MYFNDAFSDKKQSLQKLNSLLAEVTNAISVLSTYDESVEDKKYRDVLYIVNRAEMFVHAMSLVELLEKKEEI